MKMHNMKMHNRRCVLEGVQKKIEIRRNEKRFPVLRAGNLLTVEIKHHTAVITGGVGGYIIVPRILIGDNGFFHIFHGI